jgi:hypothetical protein
MLVKKTTASKYKSKKPMAKNSSLAKKRRKSASGGLNQSDVILIIRLIRVPIFKAPQPEGVKQKRIFLRWNVRVERSYETKR